MPTATDLIRDALNEAGFSASNEDIADAAQTVAEAETPTEAWAKLEAEIDRLTRRHF